MMSSNSQSEITKPSETTSKRGGRLKLRRYWRLGDRPNLPKKYHTEIYRVPVDPHQFTALVRDHVSRVRLNVRVDRILMRILRRLVVKHIGPHFEITRCGSMVRGTDVAGVSDVDVHIGTFDNAAHSKIKEVTREVRDELSGDLRMICFALVEKRMNGGFGYGGGIDVKDTDHGIEIHAPPPDILGTRINIDFPTYDIVFKHQKFAAHDSLLNLKNDMWEVAAPRLCGTFDPRRVSALVDDFYRENSAAQNAVRLLKFQLNSSSSCCMNESSLFGAVWQFGYPRDLFAKMGRSLVPDVFADAMQYRPEYDEKTPKWPGIHLEHIVRRLALKYDIGGAMLVNDELTDGENKSCKASSSSSPPSPSSPRDKVAAFTRRLAPHIPWPLQPNNAVVSSRCKRTRRSRRVRGLSRVLRRFPFSFICFRRRLRLRSPRRKKFMQVLPPCWLFLRSLTKKLCAADTPMTYFSSLIESGILLYQAFIFESCYGVVLAQ